MQIMGIFAALIAITIGIFAQKARGRNGIVWGAGTLAIISLGHIYIQLAGGSEWLWTIIVSIASMLLLVGLKPGSRAITSTVDCPFCGEEVSVKAKLCKHCGKDLLVNVVATQAVVSASTIQAKPSVLAKPSVEAKSSQSWLRKNAGEFVMLAIFFLIFASVNGKLGNVFGGVSQVFSSDTSHVFSATSKTDGQFNADVDISKKTATDPALVQQPPVAAPIAMPTTGNLPTFSQNEGYAAVRKKMLAAGWQPFHSPDADICPDGDVRCKDRPEMEACAGTGMANCRFLWKKDGKTLAIATVGEDTVFDNAEAIEAAPEQKQWVFRVVGVDSKEIEYLAPTTVSSNGRKATGFIITNFVIPHPSQSDKGTASSRLTSVEVMCDRPMIRTLQQMYRNGNNLAGDTMEISVKPTDFSAFPEGSNGQFYQIVLCMDEGIRNQRLENIQAKFPQYQPLIFSPKDIEH